MTAEHLAANAPATLRWAIAGRSRDEVERVKARLVKRHASSAHAGTVLASLDDRESLQRMAAATRVLITTVGPFIDYGEPVVRACIEQGTDYIDITGEPNYVQLLLGATRSRQLTAACAWCRAADSRRSPRTSARSSRCSSCRLGSRSSSRVTSA